MENSKEVKVIAITAKKPLPRKRSSQKTAAVKNISNESETESKVELPESDKGIPAEAVSQMASKMIDRILHNEPSEAEAKKVETSSSIRKAEKGVKKTESTMSSRKTDSTGTAKKVELTVSVKKTESTGSTKNPESKGGSTKKTDSTGSAKKGDAMTTTKKREGSAEERKKNESAQSIVYSAKKGSTGSAKKTESIISTKNKKSKSNLRKGESKPGQNGKENNDPDSVQKLTKLTDCVDCDWPYNYHPCLLSDKKDNQECKEEMKRKGYDYQEPKQCQVSKLQVKRKKSITASSDDAKKLPSKPKSANSSRVDNSDKKSVDSDAKSKKTCARIDSDSKPTKSCNAIESTKKQEEPNPTEGPTTKLPANQKPKPKARKKKTRVNFGPDKGASSLFTCPGSNESSKLDMKSSVKPTASRLADSSALEFLGKLSSKSTQNLKKSGKSDRLVASLPVSTRESRTRFNPRQPSPSATHIPPVLISAHELRCKKFDPVTAECVCESAPASRQSTKTNTEKKKNKKTELDVLVAQGKNGACDWDKNYHPCDKPEQKCDKTGDKVLCKLWKTGRSEVNTSKSSKVSTKASCKSILDGNSTLTASPSEKSYIDKVVRTAVKLAKKNRIHDCKRSRKRKEFAIDFGLTCQSVNCKATSACTTATSLAESTSNHAQPVKKKKTKKRVASALSVAESSSRKIQIQK